MNSNIWDKWRSSWSEIIKNVQKMPPHVDMMLQKSLGDDPRLFGFRNSFVAWRKGCIRNWRMRLPSGRSIHIREYADHFRVHWDFADPARNPLKHLVYDTKTLFRALSAVGLVSSFLLLVLRAGLIQQVVNSVGIWVLP